MSSAHYLFNIHILQGLNLQPVTPTACFEGAEFTDIRAEQVDPLEHHRSSLQSRVSDRALGAAWLRFLSATCLIQIKPRQLQ